MRRTLTAAVAAIAVLGMGVAAATTAVVGAPAGRAAAAEVSAPGPRGTISHDGRWLTDADGRVVQVHGVNIVGKFPAEDPPTPAEMGFDADDAAFLRSEGFNVVRLGVVFGGVMKQPGVIDQAYVDSIVATARVLGAAGIYVLLDMHQDGYGPLTHGNGFPDWATLTDGLPNPPAPFPLYYVQNPALQRAFDNFWLNAPGPDGVPLQTHYGESLAAVAAPLAADPHVLGFDTFNEPWPGTDWLSCLTGCPDIEAARLAPFADRMAAAIHAVDADAIVFTEPFTLFNFGRSATSLSGHGAPASGLSFHVYAATPEEDLATMDQAIEASSRGDALLATEFGATTDPATIDRLAAGFDTRLIPWIFWSYDENVVIDMDQAPSGDNVRAPVVTALARPYATATNGTPAAHAYDPATRVLDYSFATTRPDGSSAPSFLTTVLAMPPAAYPDGYTVEVTGAGVMSEPGAAELVLCTTGGAAEVVVRVTPGADPTPPPVVGCGDPGPPSTTSTTSVTSTTATVRATPVDLAATPGAAVAVVVSPSFTG